ncbi:MAG: DNA-binding response regulator [Firmicutes bacterium HGW-Firmicutes-9]|jgi:DNA-binding response OmpR family regulator|nr:MAG: DNA-binding response regulator [Firmicutes bacterium HGW-Firmicutes-9]
MPVRVLVADDDPALRALICDIVRQQGYDPIEAADGKQAIDRFFSGTEPGLVILDVMMPVFDGWDVLKEIRAQSDVPVMMLTALDDEQSEVTGLKHGADDYLAKPFRYAVFVARLHALLRRTNREQNGTQRFGILTIEPEKRRVTVGENEIILSNKEFLLLSLLAQNQSVVFSREKLLNKIWGFDFDGDERTVDTHIKTLRQKLLSCGEMIQTVRGSGYRFEVTP